MNCQENQWLLGEDTFGRKYYRDYNRPYSIWMIERTTKYGHRPRRIGRFVVDFLNLEVAIREAKWYHDRHYEVEIRFFEKTKFYTIYGPNWEEKQGYEYPSMIAL